MARTKSNTPGTGHHEPLYHTERTSARGYEYRNRLGMVPSNEFLHFFDDFVSNPVSDAPPGWTAVTTATGTCLTNDEHGGVLQFTGSANDDAVTIHLEECVKLAGKKFFMEARVKCEDADDNNVTIGLCAPALITVPRDAWDTTQTDFVAFGTLIDGDATPRLQYDKDNASPQADDPSGTTFDLTDGNWHIIAFAYNGADTPGVGSLSAYVDGKLAVTSTVDTQVPDNEALAPFIYGGVEDDPTDFVYVDYVRFVVER